MLVLSFTQRRSTIAADEPVTNHFSRRSCKVRLQLERRLSEVKELAQTFNMTRLPIRQLGNSDNLLAMFS